MYLCNLFWMTGNHREWQRRLPEIRAACEASDDPSVQVYAAMQLGQTATSAADVLAARSVLESTVSIADRAPALDGHAVYGPVAVRAILSGIEAFLGDFDGAVEHANAAVEIADTIGVAFHRTYARNWLMFVHEFRGDIALGLASAEVALRLAQESGLVVMLPTLMMVHGSLLCAAGRADEGVPILLKSVDISESHGIRQFYTSALVRLSEGHLLNGDVTTAHEVATRGLRFAVDRREPGVEAWLHRVLGDVAYMTESDTAEPSYQHALTLATNLGLRPFAAHCHAGLAKLYSRGCKYRQAMEHTAAAITMYGEMGMTHWRAKLESELKALR